jgi:ribosomal protein S18 acetylase RimI-like enzyme
MSTVVRRAQPADEDDAVALWRACELVSGDKDPGADFRFAIAGSASDVLLGCDEAGKLKGTVMVGHDGHRGWLYYVASDPADRGSGIGRLMVDAAEIWVVEHGIAKGQLLVLDTNRKVIAFYEHLGFAISPRIVMSKVLLRNEGGNPATASRRAAQAAEAEIP